MALKTFVKVNSITHLTDARYCAGMYVDLLGFSLEQSSEKFVSPSQFQEITGWIAGTGMCGEFETSTKAQVIALLKDYPGLTAIQHSDLEVLKAWSGMDMELIWKVNFTELIGKADELGPILSKYGIQLLLTEDSTNSSQEAENVIREYAGYAPIILGFGIKVNRVPELIETLPIKGLALEGGEEIKPGLRDFEEMAELLEMLEVEEE